VITPVAAGATWYVDDDGGSDFTSIQAAVNAASAGDTIIVRDGTYIENVDVGKSITLKSENGSASTTVSASSAYDHVFDVTVDYVNISGFTAEGATGLWEAGIYLEDANHCNISDNNVINNGDGIYLSHSSNNTLTDNTANSNNNCGIHLDYSSNNNTLANNTAEGNNYGIHLFFFKQQ